MMLWLKSLEIQGFGPFADGQRLDFPRKPGITVVYGENMRGKTSLLNAIRYAFFGHVLGRGSRERRLHTISNRELAARGQYGFSVSLGFEHDRNDYELVRECAPIGLLTPASDEDYDQHIMLRRGSSPLGPQEREKKLQLVFPAEISRFFLFDGELLQEYEELLINESEVGHRISEAIERILGLPILKNGRAHLKQLAELADEEAAHEASRHHTTQATGTSLQLATEQRKSQQSELAREQATLSDLTDQRLEAEQRLQATQKYASILEERDQKSERLSQAESEEESLRGDLQRAMSNAWRSLLREPLRAARAVAHSESEQALEGFVLSLRRQAIDSGHCGICEQDIPQPMRSRLVASVSNRAGVRSDLRAGLSASMSRLNELNRIQDADNAGEIRQLWKRIQELQLERATLTDRISDLERALSDSNPEEVRRSKTSYHEIIEKIAITKRSIEEHQKKIVERDSSIERLKAKLDGLGGSNLKTSQERARILRSAAEVFNEAVERYKRELRGRVEDTASKFFRLMTTEKDDYAGLTINEGYGLTIRHRDGKPEEARSAGAEHVVALALMGALQKNAPLRGPIVMDSPFGRLDESHTSNVIRTLPEMADQVVLLVYESEVGRQRMRDLLGKSLIREYQLERVSARRTRIRLVK